jgi:hypothetical protein
VARGAPVLASFGSVVLKLGLSLAMVAHVRVSDVSASSRRHERGFVGS